MATSLRTLVALAKEASTVSACRWRQQRAGLAHMAWQGESVRSVGPLPRTLTVRTVQGSGPISEQDIAIHKCAMHPPTGVSLRQLYEFGKTVLDEQGRIIDEEAYERTLIRAAAFLHKELPIRFVLAGTTNHVAVEAMTDRWAML